MMDHGAVIMAQAFRRALYQTSAPTPEPQTQVNIGPAGYALAGFALLAMGAAGLYLNILLSRRWTEVYDEESKGWPDFINPGTADASKGEVAIMSIGTHRFISDALDDEAKKEDRGTWPKIIGKLCVVKASDVTAAVGPWNSDKAASEKYKWPGFSELLGIVTPCVDQDTRNKRPNNIAQLFDKKHAQVVEAGAKDVGGMFKVRNKRTSREHEVWIIPVPEEFAKHGDCIVSCAQANPFRRPGEVGDFEEGDIMQFVSYPHGPASFGKLCEVSSVTRISHNEAGWGKNPNAARLGHTHVVGGHWKELELEFTFAQPSKPTHIIFGAFHQPEPFTVNVDSGGGWITLEPPEGYSRDGKWLQKHGSVAIPFTSASPIRKVCLSFDKLGDPLAVQFCTDPDSSLL